MAKSPESKVLSMNPELNSQALTKILFDLLSSKLWNLEAIKQPIMGYEVGYLDNNRIVKSRIVGPHEVPKFLIKNYTRKNFAIVEYPRETHIPPLQYVYGIYLVLEGGFRYLVPLIRL